MIVLRDAQPHHEIHSCYFGHIPAIEASSAEGRTIKLHKSRVRGSERLDPQITSLVVWVVTYHGRHPSNCRSVPLINSWLETSTGILECAWTCRRIMVRGSTSIRLLMWNYDIPSIDVTLDTFQLFRLSSPARQNDGPWISRKTESKFFRNDTSQESMGPYVL